MLTRPSLTLKRRIKAPPAQIFQAWTDPKKLVLWFGPTETVQESVRAELDVRVGGRFRVSFATGDGQRTGSAASTARWSRTAGWSYLGLAHHAQSAVARHRHVAKDGDGTLLTLYHEQFFTTTRRATATRAAGPARSTARTLFRLTEGVEPSSAPTLDVPAMQRAL
jgi:uncharacterized protein YndB with AHSA1/START domain